MFALDRVIIDTYTSLYILEPHEDLLGVEHNVWEKKNLLLDPYIIKSYHWMSYYMSTV